MRLQSNAYHPRTKRAIFYGLQYLLLLKLLDAFVLEN